MAGTKSPAFQFYAADYLADEHVTLMTLEEEGVYIRLLAYCWREGSIPADTRALSRLCKGASEESILIVKDRFEVHPNDPSRLTHSRLNAEREKQEKWSKKNSANGKKSGKARREKKLHAERSFNDRMNESRTKTNSSFSSSSSSSDTRGSGSSGSSDLAKSNGLDTSCVEPKQVRSTPGRKVAGTIPLVNGKNFPIYDDQVQQWVATYPAVDVRQELREIRAWCDANRTRRKTERGVLKFVNAWLAREQDKPTRAAGKANEGFYERLQRELEADERELDAVGGGPPG